MGWELVAATDSAPMKVLVLLLGIIGLGSAFFHAFPSSFSLPFDAIPIYLFLALALYELYVWLTRSRKRPYWLS